MRAWFARRLPSTNTLIGLLLTAVVWQLFLADPALLQRLDLLAADLRFRVRGHRLPGPEVVIAAVDEKSIDQLGRWPWPYTTQAELVERLTEYGAAVIGYDVVFSSSGNSASVGNLQNIQAKLAHPSLARLPALTPVVDALEQEIATADHDRRFAEALQHSGRTVLGYFFHFSPMEVAHLRAEELAQLLDNIRICKYNAVRKRPGVNLYEVPLISAWAVEANIAPLAQAAAGCGFFSNIADVDGGFRRYPLIVKYRNQVDREGAQDALFAPLGIRVLEQYLGMNTNALFWLGPDGVEKVGLVGMRQNYAIPTDAQGNTLLNHLGPSGTFPRYSVVDIVQRRPEAPPQAFAGKIVLVGATAEAVKDLRVTPFDPILPGVELHATMIDNILRRDFLTVPGWANLYAGGSIIILGIFLTLLFPRLGALGGGGCAVFLVAGSLAINYGLFITQGWWLSAVYPLLATVVVASGLTLYRYVVEEKDKRFLHKTFGTYLSPELITEMVRTKTEPKLGGSSGSRTAYFTDIASFSSFAEVLSATQLVELLNEYLTAMTEILLLEGGTLDKYEGDAIVAFFGAPVAQPDHAVRAIRTALGMQQTLGELRAKWTAEGEKWPDLIKQMRMRIGINSGDIVTGNMGSIMRMNYTMMGDVVNTAARLESSAKQYGIYLHCTTDTLALAGAEAEAFEWRTIDKVKFVGKTDPVETVEIMAYKGQLSESQEFMRDLYQQGMALYRQQKWDEAIAKFTESNKLEEQFPMRPTTPSQVYLERCTFFRSSPPGPDWEGIWALTSK